MLGGGWGSCKLHPSHHKTSGGETRPQERGQIRTERLGTFLGSTNKLSTMGGHSCPRGWAGRAVVEQRPARSQKILTGANFGCALSFGGTATFEGGEVDEILPISPFFFFPAGTKWKRTLSWAASRDPENASQEEGGGRGEIIPLRRWSTKPGRRGTPSTFFFCLFFFFPPSRQTAADQAPAVSVVPAAADQLRKSQSQASSPGTYLRTPCRDVAPPFLR